MLKIKYAEYFNFVPKKIYPVIRRGNNENPLNGEVENIVVLENEDGEELNINTRWIEDS